MTPEQIDALPDWAVEEALAAAGTQSTIRTSDDLRTSGDWFAKQAIAHAATLVEVKRLREAAERCAVIVERNLYHQHEKIEDVPRLLRQALEARATLKGTENAA